MDLETQIQSVAISIFFGLFVSLTFNLLYPFVLKLNKTVKFFITFLYVFINVTLFFLLLMLVNNGIIHIYFLLSLLIGFCIGNKTTKRLRYKFT